MVIYVKNNGGLKKMRFKKFEQCELESFILNVRECLKKMEENESTSISFGNDEIRFISTTAVGYFDVNYNVCIKSPCESAVEEVADILLDICLKDTEPNYIINKYIFGNSLFQITASYDGNSVSF